MFAVALALALTGASPRVLVVPAAGPDAAVDAAVRAGATAAGLAVVSPSAAGAVTCARDSVPCLLRVAALADADGAVSWKKDGASVALLVVNTATRASTSRTAPVSSLKTATRDACAQAFTTAPPSSPAAAVPPVPTPSSPSSSPSSSSPGAPASSTPPNTSSSASSTPPSATSTPSSASSASTEPGAGGVNVAGIAVLATGGVIAVGSVIAVVAIDGVLSGELTDARQHVRKLPADFAQTEDVFYGACVGAGVGVVVAGVGAFLVLE